MNLFRKKRLPGWLCLNLHPDRVDLSHVLVAGKPRPEVLLCESFRKEGSDTDTLFRLRRELELDRYRCVTLLKARDYQTVLMDRPNVPEAEVKTAVRWALKDAVDFPVATAAVDAISLPQAGDSGQARQLLAMAASQEIVSAVVKPFADADIELEVIDVPELAQRNVAQLFEKPGQGLVLVSFDESGALLTFTAGGELYQSRRIDIPLQDFEAEGDLTDLYDRVALELQRSIDHMDRLNRQLAIGQVLVASVPFAERFVRYLTANLTVPVALLDLEQVIDFPGVPELRDPLRQTQSLALIGAALRGGAVPV